MLFHEPARVRRSVGSSPLSSMPTSMRATDVSTTANLRLPRSSLRQVYSTETSGCSSHSGRQTLIPHGCLVGKQEVRAGRPGIGAITQALTGDGVEVLGEARLLAQ